MNSQTQAVADKWVEDLAASLQLYAEEKRIQSIAQLARKARVQKRMFYEIYHGRTLAKDTELYAQIFKNLKLAEADPHHLPVSFTVNSRTGLRTLKPLAWDEDRWQKWLKAQEPSRIPPINDESDDLSGSVTGSNMIQVSDAEFIQHREEEKALATRLGQKLRQWMEDHGISTSSSFAQSLDVGGNWLADIMRSGQLGFNAENYAKIYRVTHIEEATPWKLPDQWRKLPQGVIRIPRGAWKEQDYLDWVKQQEESDSFDSSHVTQPATPAPVLEVVPVQPETSVCEPHTAEVESLPIQPPPDEMVHLSLAVLAETLKSSFLELAHRGGSPPTEPVPEKSMESPPDRLELLIQSVERVESKLERLSGATNNGSADLVSTSTQALMQELKKRLISSRSAPVTHRDQLSQSIRRLAGELFPYLDAYAQATNEKRDEVLRSMKEFR